MKIPVTKGYTIQFDTLIKTKKLIRIHPYIKATVKNMIQVNIFNSVNNSVLGSTLDNVDNIEKPNSTKLDSIWNKL